MTIEHCRTPSHWGYEVLSIGGVCVCAKNICYLSAIIMVTTNKTKQKNCQVKQTNKPHNIKTFSLGKWLWPDDIEKYCWSTPKHTMWNLRNFEYSLLKLDTYPIKKTVSSKVSFPQNSYKLYINYSINMGWEMYKIDDALIFNNSLKKAWGKANFHFIAFKCSCFSIQ